MGYLKYEGEKHPCEMPSKEQRPPNVNGQKAEDEEAK